MELDKKFKFIREFYNKLERDDIFALSAQLTYYLILSIFPFLIFLMTLVSYTPITSEKAINEILMYIPENARSIFNSLIIQVVSSRSIKLLSIGMIVTLWSSSNGFISLIKGLNKAYNKKESRPFWVVRIIAILSTLILVFIFIISFVMLIFGENLGESIFKFLGLSEMFKTLWDLLRYFIALSTMMMIFIIIYFYTPAKKLPFRNVLPGSIFSTLGWIALSTLFSFYIKHFANFSRMYGSLSGIIALFIWIYWSGIIVFMGGEINAVIYLYKNKKTLLAIE